MLKVTIEGVRRELLTGSAEKIKAIKAVRVLTGYSLSLCKDIVDGKVTLPRTVRINLSASLGALMEAQETLELGKFEFIRD